MIAPTLREPPDIHHHESPEAAARVPTASTPGRSIVTRRAVVDIVRTATLGSYGVTGFGGGFFGRLLDRLALPHPGIRVTFGERAADLGVAGGQGAAGITIDLDLMVAFGVPVAEVARQVESAIRYAIRRALDREVDRLTIHVDGLRYQAGELPAAPEPTPDAVHSDDLAASGTDVA
jgi:uncharacterized alkaline shock family protein YloU